MGDNIFGVNGRMCNDELGVSYVIVHTGQALRIDTEHATQVSLSGVSDLTVYAIDEGAAIELI